MTYGLQGMQEQRIWAFRIHDLYHASAFLMSIPNFFLLFFQFKSLCCTAVPSRTMQNAAYAIEKVFWEMKKPNNQDRA